MVKAVVGDETRLNLVESRLSQSGLTSQVGLVIGRLSSALDRGFVFDLVPTPPNDDGEPACSLIHTGKDNKKKGSKSKSQVVDSSTLAIDKDWVAEHARQVSRMLVGGIKVVGIYVWVSDSSFKNSTITLLQTVKEVAEAAPISGTGTDWDERLLIHICYSPARWTCRNCMLTSNITSSSIRPCDFKMGRVLSSLQTFRCNYNFEHRLPIFQDNASNAQTLSASLRQGISIHTKELRDAKAIIDGNLVVNEEPCSTDSLHEVEVLLPFMKDVSVGASSQKDVVGLLIFGGCVCSFAYLNAKEPVSQAIADIKDDIIGSLQSRLDIICDEAGGVLVPIDDGEKEIGHDELARKPVPKLVPHLLRKTCGLSFPRRVFIPWLGGTFICDYLQPSETLEVVKDHCVELMSMEAPTDTSTILEPELDAPPLMTKYFWDLAVPGLSRSSSSVENSGKNNSESAESNEKSTKSFEFNVLAAVFFLLLAMLAGFMLVRK